MLKPTFAELPIVRYPVPRWAVLASVGAFRVEANPVGTGRKGLTLINIYVKDVHMPAQTCVGIAINIE